MAGRAAHGAGIFQREEFCPLFPPPTLRACSSSVLLGLLSPSKEALNSSFTSDFIASISHPWHFTAFQAALCGALSSQARAKTSPRTAPKCCLPFIPPEKPLQFAKTIRGSPSLLKSLIASAVLKAESGNHTCPACWIIWWEAKCTVRPWSTLV